MSAIKEKLHRVREGLEDPSEGLEKIAKALGGEVRGRSKIVTPSMVVFFSNPGEPDRFYIYECDGDIRAARAFIHKKLKLGPSDGPKKASANKEVALRLWEECCPAPGTSVERYLRSRGITLPVPPTLRYHGQLYHAPTRGIWPAMVALVTDVNDRPTAVHRTYLIHGGKRKAPVEPNKMSLGPCEGSAIRLGPVAPDILIGEGIETCLSVAMADSRPVWSAISAIGLRTLQLPPEVRSVTILIDSDDDGACERAANVAGTRWKRAGKTVRLWPAPAGKDFNDVLMEGDDDRT